MRITLELRFKNDCEEYSKQVELDLCDGCHGDMESTADDIVKELGEGWEFVGCEEIENDTDLALSDFADLDEFGQYADRVDEFGYPFVARYEDIDDLECMDRYEGCHESEESFVEDMYSDCNDIPDFLKWHINWGSVAREVMMDYSVYEVCGSVHVFSDR